MKTILFLISINCFIANAQVDTIRFYYQNGQVRSEQPTLNGKVSGLCKTFYFNGAIESTIEFKKIPGSFIFHSYYENGNSFKYTLKTKKIKIDKLYDSSGSLLSFTKVTKNKFIARTWYLNGKLSSQEVYKNGKPIICLMWVDSIIGVATNVAYCYNNQGKVFWNGKFYVDAENNRIYRHFKYKKWVFYKTGKRQSYIKQKSTALHEKIWDDNGNPILDTLKGIESPTIIVKNTGSSSTSLNSGKGYPLLKNKNPLRDTTLFMHIVKLLDDTLIMYSIATTTYDSLAISNYFGYDIIAVKTDSINSEYYDQILPYINDCQFYTTGEGEYFLAIGINKSDPHTIIVLGGKNYKDLLKMNKVLKLD